MDRRTLLLPQPGTKTTLETSGGIFFLIALNWDPRPLVWLRCVGSQVYFGLRRSISALFCSLQSFSVTLLLSYILYHPAQVPLSLNVLTSKLAICPHLYLISFDSPQGQNYQCFVFLQQTQTHIGQNPHTHIVSCFLVIQGHISTGASTPLDLSGFLLQCKIYELSFACPTWFP